MIKRLKNQTNAKQSNIQTQTKKTPIHLTGHMTGQERSYDRSREIKCEKQSMPSS